MLCEFQVYLGEGLVKDALTINTINAVGCMLAGLAVAAGAGYVFHAVLTDHNSAGFGAVALLILLGVASFLGLIAVFSLIFSWIGILDPKQAFGLPEGSVRAVLTMSFIVIVAVLASFLITSSDGGTPFDERNALTLAVNLPPAEAQSLIKATPSTDGVLAMRLSGGDAHGAVAGTGPFYDVLLYPRADHRLKEDISKQILTMLSTILAAMIGFYFGARPGESDPDAMKRAQAISQIEKAIAGLPDTADLINRAQKLVDTKFQGADQTAARNKLVALKSRLATLQGVMDAADRARLSVASTAVEMNNSASAATSAATEIAAAGKTIEEYERQP
jgi:hypothetical protein